MMGTHYTRAGLAPNLVELFTAGLGRGEVYSRHELRVEREDGKPLWLGINTSCIRGDSDESMGLSVLLTDLTAIRRLQEDLAENQRLADLGEMAAGLAHQLRNSMAAILGYGRLLKGSAPAQGQLGDWADGVLSETAETSEMITRFLDFARPLQTETTPVALHEVVASAIEQVSRQNAECGIRIAEWQAQETQPTVVRGDEMLLKQVFVNLLQNAIDASSRGKTIDVSLRKERTVNGMEFWQVVVADEGRGIPRENRGKIFHPFFTTKDTGTGLGLALARKIVASHGGRLTLQESTAAGGSTFVVALPLHAEQAQPARDRESARAGTGARPYIELR
jgi:signal transduction histidine kinase